jgi:hypothetical protein
MTSPTPFPKPPSLEEIPARPDSVEGRVEYIADLMAELRWDRGKTIRFLSQRWELAESTIKNYSAEAQRYITADEDDCRRDITAGCRELWRQCVANGDAKGAKAIGDLWATVSGAKAPEKQLVGNLEEATPARAREVMAGLFGDVTPPDAAPVREPDTGSEEDPPGA